MTEGKIGRYTIISELKRGGMATVYRAYDPRFEREVAIKVLPRELLFDPQFRLRFEREAKALAALEHPAIVPVYDFGEEDGQLYLVMRYMPCGSLFDRLQGGALSLEEAVRIIVHLAPALDEAHRHGMIHRDIKPANILFDQRDNPHITDFGVVKLIDVRTTNTGQSSIGTPAYMSPEQARGEANLDGRSDVYSLGAVLFEMLTGKIPYEADSLAGQLVRRITDPVPNILDLRPDLPPAMQSVIDRVLAKRPHARYATTGELAQALLQVAAGEYVASGEPGKQPAFGALGKDSGRTRAPRANQAGSRHETPTIAPPLRLRRRPIAIYSLVIFIVVVMAAFGALRMLGGQGIGGLPPENTPQVVLAAEGPAGSPTPFLPALGTVIEMRGVVQLQRAGQGAQLLVTGDVLPYGEALRLWTTNGVARVRLTEGSLLVLGENTLVVFHAPGNGNGEAPDNGQEALLTLEQGRLLVKAAQFRVYAEPHDHQVELIYAVAGVFYDPVLELFEVDCLEGSCLVVGQPAVGLEGGSRANFGRGQLLGRADAIYPPWIELGGSDVPTPTPTPTGTPTPTATEEPDEPPEPTNTQSVAPPPPQPVPTNTQRPPQPVPTNTSPPPAPTNPPPPTNTSAPPPSPTSGSSNEG